jgi:membrane-associated phospholipid phosphatase
MNLYYAVGNNGQYILYFITVYLLWGYFAIYYSAGIVLNSMLNILLKGIFREPRPSEVKYFNQARKDGKKRERFVFKNGMPKDRFGMPSGHAESTMFSSVFIYNFNKKIIPFYLFIAFITMTQRVYYKYHTTLQVIIGAIVGIIFGILFLNILKFNLLN